MAPPESDHTDQRPALPDQHARDRITGELDRTMLVEAAAGTGKTTSMVARMIALVREGKCTVERMAAVTFTRKAAAQLRGRFRLGIERETRTASGQARERLDAALEKLERCFIGTIHSFCGRILRERPIEAGVDLAFTEIEEDEDAELRQSAWHRHVAMLVERGDPLLGELDAVGLEPADLEEPFTGSFADFPDVSDWPAEQIAIPQVRIEAARTALEALVAHVREIDRTLPQDTGNDMLMPKLRLLLRMTRQTDLATLAGLMEVIAEIKELPASRGVVQKKWPGGKAQALEELDHWNQFTRDTAQPLIDWWLCYRYPVAMRVLAPARAVYDDLRRKRSTLNFQDLLMRAAALLRDSPNVRTYFRARITHLLVDEFQDTDPIQAEVMLLLTASDPRQSQWARCRPVPGSLFVVGDPKQSIYRFRRADFETYARVKRIIEDSGGSTVRLTANFRSIAPLVDWANSACTDLFPCVADTYAPERVLMDATGQDGTGADLSGLRVVTVDGTANVDDLVASEAERIARFIRHAIDHRLTIPRKDTAPSSLSPGDFMILTAQRKHMSVYGRTLERYGIPHAVTGGTMAAECEELRLLHAGLCAVIQPEDAVATVAVLRSALFGISDADLYRFKKAGGRFYYPGHRVPAGGPWSAPIEDALQRLERYASWARTMPPVAAAWATAQDLGLIARACEVCDANLRAGAFAKVLEMLRARQSEGFTMPDLVEELGRLLEPGSELDAMPARPHGEDVVRILNLHKAKGLEASVVFLADPTGPRVHPADRHVRRSASGTQGYMAVCRWNGFRQVVLAHPADWPALAAQEERFLDAERNRLLYVAATRARVALVITRPDRTRKDAARPWEMLAGRLGPAPELPDPGTLTPFTPPTWELSPADAADSVAAIDESWRRAAVSTYAILPATQAAGAVVRLHADSKSLGAEWGSAIHALLEAIAVDPGANLHTLARSVFEERDLPPGRADEAVGLVRGVVTSALWSRWRASSRRLAEVPVSVLAPAEPDKPPTILRGVIDLAFEEDGGWVIVDYKTDAAATGDLAPLIERYRPQLDAYARMWSLATGSFIKEKALFFVASQKYVCV